MCSVPKKLYKYRPLKATTIAELESNVVYYANPKNFNDPLDCSPVINVDIDTQSLEKLCFAMLSKTQKGSGDSKAISKRIDKIRYYSNEPNWDGTPSDSKSKLKIDFAREIQNCLEKLMRRKGVLSLAQRWNCPLMWSHYADQHNGICIEYDTSQLEFAKPFAVDYSGVRDIKASDLYGWIIDELITSRKRVHDSYFYRKASQWRYEKEWRHVRDGSGVDASPYLISAIYFGLRCSHSVAATLAKLFRGTDNEPKFYGICEDSTTFRLKRYRWNIDELVWDSPSISQYWREKEAQGDFSVCDGE